MSDERDEIVRRFLAGEHRVALYGDFRDLTISALDAMIRDHIIAQAAELARLRRIEAKARELAGCSHSSPNEVQVANYILAAGGES